MSPRVGLVPHGVGRYLVVLAGETQRHSSTVLGWVERWSGDGWRAFDNMAEPLGFFPTRDAAVEKVTTNAGLTASS